MLNKVGSEKIPLPLTHLLLRFAVYRDSYLDTNVKIAIYHDTVFRGDTHPYLPSILLLICNEFNKFNNTQAGMLDSVYHMTFKLFCNHIFGVKMSILCKYMRRYGRQNATKICKLLVVY